MKIVEKFNEKCTLLISPAWLKLIEELLNHARREVEEIDFQNRLGVPPAELDELLCRLQSQLSSTTDIFELECGNREEFSGMICHKLTSPELMIIRQCAYILVNAPDGQNHATYAGFEYRRLKTLMNILDMLIV